MTALLTALAAKAAPYIIGAGAVLATLIAVALTGYLCVALLKPEWFE